MNCQRKTFIMFQFFMCHRKNLNNCINKIQGAALRLNYENNHSSRELLGEDNYMSIHHKNFKLLAAAIYEVKNYIISQIMKKIFELKKPL